MPRQRLGLTGPVSTRPGSCSARGSASLSPPCSAVARLSSQTARGSPGCRASVWRRCIAARTAQRGSRCSAPGRSGTMQASGCCATALPESPGLPEPPCRQFESSPSCSAAMPASQCARCSRSRSLTESPSGERWAERADSAASRSSIAPLSSPSRSRSPARSTRRWTGGEGDSSSRRRSRRSSAARPKNGLSAAVSCAHAARRSSVSLAWRAPAVGGASAIASASEATVLRTAREAAGVEQGRSNISDLTVALDLTDGFT